MHEPTLAQSSSSLEGQWVPTLRRCPKRTTPTTPTQTDDELSALMLAASGGCKLSFARLYALTQHRLFGVTLRICNDRDDAKDLLQEVYLKVWMRSGQFDARKGCAIGWLIGIAQHTAIDAFRKRRTHPKPANVNGAGDEESCALLPSTEPQPVDCIIQARMADAVRRSLSKLSMEQRESLRLSYYEGLSQSEIAARLGRPLGTVKSWMRRSLDAMRPGLEMHR
jgi:RNA polymerase sigma factor (sigma-70 family)